jgi:hypothetical protein
MTTTVTTKIQHPSSNRLRRNVVAGLVGGALLVSSAVVVNRIVGADAAPVAHQSPSEPLPVIPLVEPAVVAPAAVGPRGRFVIHEPAWFACGIGVTDVCPFAFIWVPELSSPAEAAAEVCRGGLEWACAFTQEAAG